MNQLTAKIIDGEINRIQNKFKTGKPTSPLQILDALLEKIRPVNFKKEVDIDDKLQKKHFIVIVVDKIIQLARANNWGLCKRYDFVYLYNGDFWVQLDENDLKNFLGKAAQNMGVDRFDANYHRFRDELLKQFIAVAHLPTPETDRETVLVNLKNGTLEITPAANNAINLREHRRGDFLTYQIPFDYNPEAEAPRFHSYLAEVLPDQKMKNILSEYLGYLFVNTSFMKLEKALILYGTGANGKSVFFEIVNAMLGRQNVSTYTLQSLTNQNGYYRAKIADKLVNYASEINGNLEASLFKQLVSGEPVEARLPYGEPFTLTDYAKFCFNCNQLPKEVEHTSAFFRRFMIVPFEVTIPEEKQDKKLSSKIIDDELSGVFNWVLDGLKRLLHQGNFTHSDKVENEVKQYRKESDSVATFVEEEEYKPDGNYTKLKKIYRDYRDYCINDGYRPVSKRNFKKRLQALNIVTERNRDGNVVYLSRTTNF